MTNKLKNIALEIKTLQISLNKLLEYNEKELLSDEVLAISKRLDSLIIEYYKADQHQRPSYVKKKDH